MSEQYDEASKVVDLENDEVAFEAEADAAVAPEETPDESAKTPDQTPDENPEVVSDEVAVEVPDAVIDEASDETTDETSDEDEFDPLAEFRAALHAKVGDWFVVHTYSGMENRVKANLENRITSLNMEDYIHEVIVPTEEVAEIKNGQRKLVKRTVLPGYVLVRMDLTDESWAAVRHTPSVTGFVGHSHQPVPLSLDEVENML
ncbi:MAG: antitermination protein NusG, partial [Marmoricola sp.]|nr:antitermination protein NusG [Marmoricola sp.]